MKEQAKKISSKVPEFFFHITNGQITNPRVVDRHYASLPDGSYRGNSEIARKRSLPQNSYYWACVVPLVREGLVNNGFREVKTDEDAHEVMKHLFLKKKIVNEETGEVITEIAGSTKKLTTIEFMTYLEEIAQWASQYLGISIPAPNSQTAIWSDEQKL